MSDIKSTIRTTVFAFILTAVGLSAIVCGVRVDATTRYALTGTNDVYAAAWQTELSRIVDVTVDILPPRAATMVEMGRTEIQWMTDILHQFLS